MTEFSLEIDSELLDKIEQHCEEITAEMEKIYGGRPETHSFRVDQSILVLVESLIEWHFKSCIMHEIFMKRIRTKSKSIIIGKNGRMSLAAKHGDILIEQAKETIIKIVEISSKLGEESGVPDEIFAIRFLLTYINVLLKIYGGAKSKYLGDGIF